MLDETRPCRFFWGTGGATKYIQDGIEYGPNKQPIADTPTGDTPAGDAKPAQGKAGARPWQRGGPSIKAAADVAPDAVADVHMPDEVDD